MTGKITEELSGGGGNGASIELEQIGVRPGSRLSLPEETAAGPKTEGWDVEDSIWKRKDSRAVWKE